MIAFSTLLIGVTLLGPSPAPAPAPAVAAASARNPDRQTSSPVGAAQTTPPVNRDEAIRLARTGAHAEALRQFQLVVRDHPEDLEARIWIGRLQLWLGHPREARETFAAVLAVRPDAVDALVGVGDADSALGQPEEAIATLQRAASQVPGDADVIASLARAHRRAGQTTAALREFERAAALRPADRDIRLGLEQTRRAWAHGVEVGYFGEDYNGPISGAVNGEINLSLRVSDDVRALARVQTQRKFGFTDTRAGAGVEWRVRRNVTVAAMALFAGDAQVLPSNDVAGELRYVRGRAELSGGVRHVSFDGASVWIASPALVYWISDRWAVTGRYFRSQTNYDRTTLGSVGANSGAVQTSVNVRPRLWLSAAYARGNETFETLSPDRIGRFGADTLGGGARVDLPSLSSVAVGVEHQWRHDNDRRMLRVTVGVAQRF